MMYLEGVMKILHGMFGHEEITHARIFILGRKVGLTGRTVLLNDVICVSLIQRENVYMILGYVKYDLGIVVQWI